MVPGFLWSTMGLNLLCTSPCCQSKLADSMPTKNFFGKTFAKFYYKIIIIIIVHLEFNLLHYITLGEFDEGIFCRIITCYYYSTTKTCAYIVDIGGGSKFPKCNE
jgi:fatty-acid desaturase